MEGGVESVLFLASLSRGEQALKKNSQEKKAERGRKERKREGAVVSD